MNLVIDEFNSTTGFIAYNNASIVGTVEISDFIAGYNNTASVQFEFSGEGDYIEKDGLSIDVSDYSYAVCHFYSSFSKMTSGLYTIAFNDIHEFEIDLYPYLTFQYFALNEISTIEKIRITYYGTSLDRLICSHCLAVLDEIPVDMFVSIQNIIETEINDLIGDGFLLGTLDANSGDSQIALNQLAYTALEYIDRYSVIKIDDGVNSEVHVLEDNDERYFELEDAEDGNEIINDFTDANCYLTIPVRYGVKQQIYNTPSINITGYTPTPILRGGKVETVFTTKESGTSYERKDDQIYEYRFQVACITRMENDIMTFMSKLVRDIIARKILWINGQKYDISFDGEPEFIELEGYDNTIVGLVYTIKLEVKEEIWKNQKLPKLISQNLTITMGQF